MKWLGGTKVVRISSVLLPADFEERLRAPHVRALAESIKANGNVPASLPVVRWNTKGSRKELVAGGDRTAALVLNGLRREEPSDDLVGTLEVRAFEGDEADVKRLRRDENIHRRQDRDRWLRELVEEEARELAAARAAQGPQPAPVAGFPDIPAKLDPPSLPLPGVDQQAGAPSRPLVEPHAPWCSLDTDHGGACRPATGIGDGEPCGTCGHAAIDHDGNEASVYGCGAQKCACKVFVRGLAEPPPAPTKADKAEARKRVAERQQTSPAAVKQAELRDRKKRGETQPARRKHDDSGGSPVQGLTPEQYVQLGAYLDGFARGADHKTHGKRHAVDPATHENWKRGHADGVAAARAAEETWKAIARKGAGL